MSKEQPKPIGVWNTADSTDGERSLRQHFFIPFKRGKFWEDEYIGNTAICSRRIGLADENERYVTIDNIDPEEQKSNCCKKCLKEFLDNECSNSRYNRTAINDTYTISVHREDRRRGETNGED